MTGPGEAYGDALGDTIGGMFDIPEMNIVEQTEEAWTIGDSGSSSTPSPEDYWDPLAGF